MLDGHHCVEVADCCRTNDWRRIHELILLRNSSHVSRSGPVGLAGAKRALIGRFAETGGTVITQSNRATVRRIVNGKALHAAVVNEHQARAAAGITMALGAAAFVYANFDKLFWPIRTVSALFCIDFLVRVTAGLERSPTGVVAGWMTRRHDPQWVSTKPKRFAWSMGLAMALAMTIITNSGIHGPLPRTICLTCLALMWMEAVLGLCVGCEIYGVMVRRGWRAPDDAYEICANGACDLDVAKNAE